MRWGRGCPAQRSGSWGHRHQKATTPSTRLRRCPTGPNINIPISPTAQKLEAGLEAHGPLEFSTAQHGQHHHHPKAEEPMKQASQKAARGVRRLWAEEEETPGDLRKPPPVSALFLTGLPIFWASNLSNEAPRLNAHRKTIPLKEHSLRNCLGIMSMCTVWRV